MLCSKNNLYIFIYVFIISLLLKKLYRLVTLIRLVTNQEIKQIHNQHLD